MKESDSGKTVKADVGESLDTRVLTSKEGEYTPPSGGLGGGGSMKWSLKAVAPGKTEFRLKLWRPWEGEASVQKRFNVTLIVH